jgi:hypothetical protein
MTWSNINREFRKEINKTLNLICELCGVAYMTDFTLVKYCNDCIEGLEMEMDYIDEN